jgi:hypothetical protein
MSELFDALRKRYQALIVRKEAGEGGEELLEDVRSFIADAQRAGAVTADPAERSQLRAFMRFLADVVYDATEVYPDTILQPLDRERLDVRLPETRERAAPQWLLWAVVAAAIIVSVVGIWLALALRSTGESTSTPTPPLPPTFTPMPVPLAAVQVGAGSTEEGRLALPAKIFCAGAPAIVAEFDLSRLPADARWGWRLYHEGHMIDDDEAPIREADRFSTTVTMTSPDGGFASGQYELAASVDGEVVAASTFTVLEDPPQVTNLRVSDVPEGEGQEEFAVGVPLLIITYDYENLCPAQTIRRVIYRDGEIVHQSPQVWTGVSSGSERLDYYRQDGLPLPTGGYRAVVTVDDTRPQEVNFAITGLQKPVVGPITLAQGMDNDTQPFGVGDSFPYGIRALYAVFDYMGMTDGLEWSVVWTRVGTEVAKQSGHWNTATDGSEGIRWVVYREPAVTLLRGGSYSVTLYITDTDTLQRSVDFTIWIPVTPTPAP